MSRRWENRWPAEYQRMSEYARAKLEEARLLPMMRAHFDIDLEQTIPMYALFDYESSKYCIELKTRFKYRHNAFPDYMMGLGKISAAEQDTSGRQYVFVFQFTDGIWYWEYDRSLELETRFCGREDRGVDEKKWYAMIPRRVCKKL